MCSYLKIQKHEFHNVVSLQEGTLKCVKAFQDVFWFSFTSLNIFPVGTGMLIAMSFLSIGQQ